ncbi:MAG: ABC transporter permease [Pyrinomonadaceae bacterium]|nr:ABC transporter permease [Pyrinomonadaceae bacterium]
MLSRFMKRLRALMRKDELENELDEELRYHLEREIEGNMASGMSPEEARRAARRSFGGVEQSKENCRDARQVRLLDEFWQDIRYGVRMLVKNPGFTFVAVLALALGIGANTAIYSVIDTVLLRPLPFAEQERLVVLWKRDTTANNPLVELSVAEFADWQKQSTVFESLAAMPTTVYGYGYTVTGRGEPFQVESARVSDSFFPTLGVQANLGRTFIEEDDRPGAGRTVVLNHRFWRDRLNMDSGIIGQQITLRGENYTIVGVMPPEFDFPKGAEMWAPLRASMNQRTVENRGNVFLQAIGRLKPGVTIEQANAEMNTIIAQLARQYPEANAGGHRVVITPLAHHIFGDARPALHLLLAASVLLLLIACINIANFLLARATVRHKEVTLRAALGASRGRLVRQFLTESVLLAAIGGTCGLLLAHWMIKLLLYFAPADIPRIEMVSIDVSVMTFTCVVTLLTAVMFGLAPALTASKVDLNESLKEGSTKVAGARHSHRLRSWLVIAEVAVTLVLLISASLVVRSFLNLKQVPLGFDPRNVLTAQLSLQGQKYRDVRERRDFFKRLLERLEAQPGVIAAGAVLIRPLEGTIGWDMPFATEGQTLDETKRNAVPNYEVITPHYFRAMGIQIVKGRDFTEEDTEQTPEVVIISETMARRIFKPDTDPLGQQVKLEPTDSESPWRTVVGVVSDVRYRELSSVRYDVYVPYRQSTVTFRYVTIRTATDPLALIPTLRREVSALDETQAVADVRTMEQLVARSLARPRFSMLLLGFFAFFAAALSSVGIYGILSYSVMQRTNEIGIRVALGAQRSDILKLVIRQGMVLTAIGIVIGLSASLAFTRVMSSLLYNVSVTDPVTFVAVAALLTVVALLACYIPARRATKLDPLLALKHE